MVWFKRIFLFAVVNILVVVTVSLVLNLLGVRPYLNANGIDYQQLMVFCLVWGMAGSFISLALSRVMAKWMMGVRVIDPNTMDPTLRGLIGTVYNLAHAAQLPAMPEVGIYESPEVNAFATGPTKSRALVAVSSGLLNRMNREEAEGVLGHEIAHIANGDMVTMTLLQGVINAFVMFFARIIAFAVANALRSNDDERSSPMIQMLVTIVCEICLSILGSMVVAWFSRLREYRADRGGAELVGRGKMVAALEALRRTVEIVDPRENEAIAAFKISGHRTGFRALFSTHPPLEERIMRLRQMA